MKRLFVGIISNSLMVVLPLLLKPHLMADYRIIIILLGGMFIWLTQPVISASETRENKGSDSYSVLVILLASLVSVVAPIIHWAYFMNEQGTSLTALIAGLVIMITGLLMRAWAVSTLGMFFTPTVQIKEEHRLVTIGPYALVRHPSYTGAYLAIVAPAVILNSVPGMLIAATSMALAYYIRIKIEEKALLQHFGDEYKAYIRRTKMLIPYVW